METFLLVILKAREDPQNPVLVFCKLVVHNLYYGFKEINKQKMPQKQKLSAQDRRFLVRLNRGGKTFYDNVKLGHKANVFTLDDKKRCCLIATAFKLEDFTTQQMFEVRGEETVFKPQWFHSAIMLYMFLSQPNLASTQCGVHVIIETGMGDIFLAIAKEVLYSDADGVECVKVMDRESNKIEVNGDKVLIESERKT